VSVRLSCKPSVLTTIILIAYGLRLYHIDFQPLWSDEKDSLVFASQIISTLLSNMNRPGWNGPLFHLLLHFWIQHTGSTGFSLRLFSLFFGVLSVALAYPLGSSLMGKRFGIILSLLMASSPYLIWYSQEAKMYSLLLFLSMLSLFLFSHSCKSNRWSSWSLYLLVTWASWYVHLLSVLLVPFHFILWFIIHRRSAGKRITWTLLLWLLALGLLYIPLAKWEIPIWLSTFETGHRFYPLLTIVRTQLFVFATGYPSPFSFVTALSFALLFICGLRFPIGEEEKCSAVSVDRWTRGLLLLYFAIPLLALYLISFGMPIYTDRYLITTAPAFYGVCAAGLIVIRRKWPVFSVGLALILVIFNLLTVYVQANTISKPPIPLSHKIAFAAEDKTGKLDIWLMNTDGSNRHRFLNRAYESWAPNWSPDGKRIVFAGATARPGAWSAIYVINIDGTGLSKLTEPPSYGERLGVGRPVWSPDGTKIAFEARVDDRASDIYVMDADGSNIRRLTDHWAVDRRPAWSPDGRYIVFDTERAGSREIYIMESHGNNKTNLTERTHDANPVWSPDGQYIAFVSFRDGNGEVYRMRTEGSEQINLTKNPADDVDIGWTSDRRIVFASDRDGDYEIYIMEADGTRITQLTSNSVNDRFPAWSAKQIASPGD